MRRKISAILTGSGSFTVLPALSIPGTGNKRIRRCLNAPLKCLPLEGKVPPSAADEAVFQWRFAIVPIQLLRCPDRRARRKPQKAERASPFPTRCRRNLHQYSTILWDARHYGLFNSSDTGLPQRPYKKIFNALLKILLVRKRTSFSRKQGIYEEIFQLPKQIILKGDIKCRILTRR